MRETLATPQPPKIPGETESRRRRVARMLLAATVDGPDWPAAVRVNADATRVDLTLNTVADLEAWRERVGAGPASTMRSARWEHTSAVACGWQGCRVRLDCSRELPAAVEHREPERLDERGHVEVAGGAR